MTIKAAINGFGRIGRMVLRAGLANQGFDQVLWLAATGTYEYGVPGLNQLDGRLGCSYLVAVFLFPVEGLHVISLMSFWHRQQLQAFLWDRQRTG